jgi:hypothetical protein
MQKVMYDDDYGDSNNNNNNNNNNHIRKPTKRRAVLAKLETMKLASDAITAPACSKYEPRISICKANKDVWNTRYMYGDRAIAQAVSRRIGVP